MISWLKLILKAQLVLLGIVGTAAVVLLCAIASPKVMLGLVIWFLATSAVAVYLTWTEHQDD